MKLIIASNNDGKIKEYREILEPFGFQVHSQGEEGIHIDVEETGTTFEENAILKARAVYETARCCVISDDSGTVHKETLHNIVEQAYALIKDRRQVVIVSSGAGICGVGAINKWQRRGDMNYKQALCAIDSILLLRQGETLF